MVQNLQRFLVVVLKAKSNNGMHYWMIDEVSGNHIDCTSSSKIRLKFVTSSSSAANDLLSRNTTLTSIEKTSGAAVNNIFRDAENIEFSKNQQFRWKEQKKREINDARRAVYAFYDAYLMEYVEKYPGTIGLLLFTTVSGEEGRFI